MAVSEIPDAWYLRRQVAQSPETRARVSLKPVFQLHAALRAQIKSIRHEQTGCSFRLRDSLRRSSWLSRTESLHRATRRIKQWGRTKRLGGTINDAKLQLENYQNHETAIDDGYQNAAACIEGLGIPFVKEDVPQVSYDTPNVLLYEQLDTDQYELVGAEWFVPASDTDEPPALFAGGDRETSRGPMEGHYSEQPTHYGLHVWLFTENQNGLFADTNPDITCSD